MGDASIAREKRREESTLAKSHWLVYKANEMSKAVLIPLLQSYEQYKAGSKEFKVNKTKNKESLFHWF